MSETDETAGKVIDLMAALKASLAGGSASEVQAAAAAPAVVAPTWCGKHLCHPRQCVQYHHEPERAPAVVAPPDSDRAAEWIALGKTLTELRAMCSPTTPEADSVRDSRAASSRKSATHAILTLLLPVAERAVRQYDRLSSRAAVVAPPDPATGPAGGEMYLRRDEFDAIAALWRTSTVGSERRADSELLDEMQYHGCLTGDCPHEFQGQCDKALADDYREIVARRADSETGGGQ